MKHELEVKTLSAGCTFLDQAFPVFVELANKYEREEWEAMTDEQKADAVRQFVETSDRENLLKVIGALLASSPTITDTLRQFVGALLDPSKNPPALDNLEAMRDYAEGCNYVIGLKVQDMYKIGQ